jgi:tRNA modification GTPase
MYIEDTIAAISTPPGVGGIAIIRVSGKNAIKIVAKIFEMKNKKNFVDAKSHRIYYGYIREIKSNKILDEVLVSVMKEPNTFTREDTVEINCHGGSVVAKKVLEEVIYVGARLAEPGEFTKRAFLNGRIDLVQAEAIIDIINAKTDNGLSVAVGQLEGGLSEQLKDIRKRILSLSAHLQAAVDFPEEEIEELKEENVEKELKDILFKIEGMLSTADIGKIVRDGLNTVIIGRPNVGKSSLLNAMVREKRAIVTEIPGTTRDIIEEYINIKGIPLKVIDTAGIRDTNDIIEKIGVKKSKELINNAELIILILDGSEEITENDRNIISLVKEKNTIVLINKTDLNVVIDYDYIENIFKENIVLEVSVKEGTGLEDLENAIYDMFYSGKVKINNDYLITNIRHKELLIRTGEEINQALTSLNEGMPMDMITIDLNNAIQSMGEILGLTVSEEIIDRIFRDFCLGK